MRGVQKLHSKTVTSAMLGEFRKDPKSREEFMSLIQRNWNTAVLVAAVTTDNVIIPDNVITCFSLFITLAFFRSPAHQKFRPAIAR